MIPLFERLGFYDRTFTRESLQLQPLVTSTDLRNALQAAGFDTAVLKQFQARQWDFRSILPELHDGSFAHHFDWHDQPDHPYRYYLIGLANALAAIYDDLALSGTVAFTAFRESLQNDGHHVPNQNGGVVANTLIVDVPADLTPLEKTINQSKHDDKGTLIHHLETARQELDNGKFTAVKENSQNDGCVSNRERRVETDTPIVDVPAELSLLEKTTNQNSHDDKATLIRHFETARRESPSSLPDTFEITLSLDLSVYQMTVCLEVLADYYRACGGVGFRSDFELVGVLAGEPPMSSFSDKTMTIIVRIRALFPNDWTGSPGKRFRKTTQAISDFADEHHITSAELLHDGVDLGRQTFEGFTSHHEYAEALKNFAKDERVRLETEVQKRAMGTKFRRQTGEARKPEEEALFAEISIAELVGKLQDAKVLLRRDAQANLTALPVPHGISLGDLLDQRTLPARGNVTEESDGVHVRGGMLGPISFPGKLLLVEPGARVQGDLHADVIQILAGAEVRGKVHGTTHVQIRRDGRLIGDIQSAKITIEDEACFRGEVDITKK